MVDTDAKRMTCADNAIGVIATEFASTVRPNENNIVVDGSRSNVECSSVWDRLSGLAWQEVKPDQLRDGPDAYVCLTATAFRYYLPAFMTWALLKEDGFGTLRVSLIDEMTLTSSSQHVFLERFLDLTAGQRTAVVEFLRCSKISYPDDLGAAVDRALSSHWAE